MNEISGNAGGSVYVLDVKEDLLVCTNTSFLVPHFLRVAHLVCDGSIEQWVSLSDPCQDNGSAFLTPYYMALTTFDSEDVSK